MVYPEIVWVPLVIVYFIEYVALMLCLLLTAIPTNLVYWLQKSVSFSLDFVTNSEFTKTVNDEFSEEDFVRYTLMAKFGVDYSDQTFDNAKVCLKALCNNDEKVYKNLYKIYQEQNTYSSKYLAVYMKALQNYFHGNSSVARKMAVGTIGALLFPIAATLSLVSQVLFYATITAIALPMLVSGAVLFGPFYLINKIYECCRPSDFDEPDIENNIGGVYSKDQQFTQFDTSHQDQGSPYSKLTYN